MLHIYVQLFVQRDAPEKFRFRPSEPPSNRRTFSQWHARGGALPRCRTAPAPSAGPGSGWWGSIDALCVRCLFFYFILREFFFFFFFLRELQCYSE